MATVQAFLGNKTLKDIVEKESVQSIINQMYLLFNEGLKLDSQYKIDDGTLFFDAAVDLYELALEQYPDNQFLIDAGEDLDNKMNIHKDEVERGAEESKKRLEEQARVCEEQEGRLREAEEESERFRRLYVEAQEKTREAKEKTREAKEKSELSGKMYQEAQEHYEEVHATHQLIQHQWTVLENYVGLVGAVHGIETNRKLGNDYLDRYGPSKQVAEHLQSRGIFSFKGVSGAKEPTVAPQLLRKVELDRSAVMDKNKTIPEMVVDLFREYLSKASFDKTAKERQAAAVVFFNVFFPDLVRNMHLTRISLLDVAERLQRAEFNDLRQDTFSMFGGTSKAWNLMTCKLQDALLETVCFRDKQKHEDPYYKEMMLFIKKHQGVFGSNLKKVAELEERKTSMQEDYIGVVGKQGVALEQMYRVH